MLRPKVIAVILFTALGVLGTVDLILRLLDHKSGSETPSSLVVAKTETGISPQKDFSTPSPLSVAKDKTPVVAQPVVQETKSANHDPGYVQERIAELTSLAMNDDSKSLETIWSELSNPNKEIRAGALAAVVQFGDRSVIMRLHELASQTEDPAEKASILAAADYLSLPTLSELPAGQRVIGSPNPARKNGPPRRPPSQPVQGN